MNPIYSARKITMGLFLRCPNCEKGKMSNGLFSIQEKCPVCGVRFERKEGEAIGGAMLNLSIVEVVTATGIILTIVLFHVPITLELAFWIPFNIIFVFLFYRHARAIWVSINYLTGGVYPDPVETPVESEPKP